MRALLVLALMALVACGPAPSVELDRPAAPPAPTYPEKPSTPTTNPEDGSVVTPAPTPIPVPATPRLRVVCADAYHGTLHTISSAARPTDGVPMIEVQFGPQEAAILSNPVPVAYGTTRDELVVLAEGARRLDVSARGPIRLLLVAADLPMRKGNATDLGARVSLVSDVAVAAEKLGLQQRNFGASDKGTYLILPRGKAFEIVMRTTLQKVATLSLDPAKTVMPQIFEADSLVAALVYDGGTFKVATAKLSVQPSGASIGTLSQLVPSAGSSFSAPSSLSSGVLVWGESNVKTGAITFVTYDAKKASISRARFTMAAGEKAAPQFAVVRSAGNPVIAVALENSSPLRTPTELVRQLESGRLAHVRLGNGSAVEIASHPYPANVVRMSKVYGFDGSFAARRVIAPTGSLEAILAIDVGAIGETLYKVRGSGALDGVGGLECRNPNVIEEVQ